VIAVDVRHVTTAHASLCFKTCGRALVSAIGRPIIVGVKLGLSATTEERTGFVGVERTPISTIKHPIPICVIGGLGATTRRTSATSKDRHGVPAPGEFYWCIWSPARVQHDKLVPWSNDTCQFGNGTTFSADARSVLVSNRVLVSKSDDIIAAYISDEITFAEQPANSAIFVVFRYVALHRRCGVIYISADGLSEVLYVDRGREAKVNGFSINIEAEKGCQFGFVLEVAKTSAHSC
jgi:hypothetical protein